MPELPPPPRAATRRIPLAIGAVLIGVAIGFAVLYGTGGLNRQTGDAACRPAVELARKIAPLAHGEVAALTMATAPLRLPDLAFEDAAGQPKKAIGLARADGSGEPVGHLVRALPQGDARARRVCRPSSGERISRWWRSISTPAIRKSRRIS